MKKNRFWILGLLCMCGCNGNVVKGAGDKALVKEPVNPESNPTPQSQPQSQPQPQSQSQSVDFDQNIINGLPIGNLKNLLNNLNNKNASYTKLNMECEGLYSYAALAITQGGDKSLAILKYLHSKGEDANPKGHKNDTVIHVAAREGKTDVLKYLVEEKQINVDTVDDGGKTPLYNAIFAASIDNKKNAQDVIFLISKGASTNVIPTDGSMKLLAFAFCIKPDEKSFEIVCALLDNDKTPKIDDYKIIFEMERFYKKLLKSAIADKENKKIKLKTLAAAKGVVLQ